MNVNINFLTPCPQLVKCFRHHNIGCACPSAKTIVVGKQAFCPKRPLVPVYCKEMYVCRRLGREGAPENPPTFINIGPKAGSVVGPPLPLDS